MIASGDPIAKARRRLIERDGVAADVLDAHVVEATAEMADLLAEVRAGPEPDIAGVMDDVFAGNRP